MRRLVAVPVILIASFALHALSATDVTPRGLQERVWVDKHGRAIMILDEGGVLTLITRDEEGRVVQVVGLAGKFTAKTAEGPVQADTAWAHYFSYASGGELQEEIDCTGTRHSFEGSTTRRLDRRRGTALAGHRHVSGTAGPAEKPAPAPQTDK